MLGESIEDSNEDDETVRPLSLYEAAHRGEGSAGVPLLRFLGVRMVAPSAPDVAISMEMDRRDEILNPTGIPHGGAIASLIDHCGGLAVGTVMGRGGPTADLHIRYLRPPDGSPIRADARILRTGRRLAVVEVRVYGESGSLAAIGTMSTAPVAPDPVSS